MTRNNVDRPDEKPLCETKVNILNNFWGENVKLNFDGLQRMTMHLKSALNTDKEFRFIINSVEYSQKVMTETCT